jgi:hypothetical protein
MKRRNPTLIPDVAVIVLVVLFAWLGLEVHDGVDRLASVGRGLSDAGQAVGGTARDAAGAVRTGFGAAADALDATPLIGGGVADALRSAGGSAAAPVDQAGQDSARRLIASGRESEAQVHHAANLLGWLTFGIPTLLLLTAWLPFRWLVRRQAALRLAVADLAERCP